MYWYQSEGNTKINLKKWVGRVGKTKNTHQYKLPEWEREGVNDLLLLKNRQVREIILTKDQIIDSYGRQTV